MSLLTLLVENTGGGYTSLHLIVPELDKNKLVQVEEHSASAGLRYILFASTRETVELSNNFLLF